MNRQLILTALISFTIGTTATSLLMRHSQNEELQSMTGVAKNAIETTRVCVDGSSQVDQYKVEVFNLAKTYQETSDPAQKVEIADRLIHIIKQFNLTGSM